MTANGLVAVGFCYGQTTITPQWRYAYTQVLMRDAATRRRIVGEFAHEASGAHIATARCDIVRRFLTHPQQPDWLWLVDTDATFAPDVLDRMLATAHAKDRPILGALAFGVRPAKDEDGQELFNEVGAVSLELFPTIYVLDNDHRMLCVHSYPRGQVIQVHSTGAHCLLIHRLVLSDPRWTPDEHPLPWFRNAVKDGQEVSEDQFFCLRAGALGYPVHINTAIKTGHVKTFVADESLFDAQRGAT